MARWEGWNFGDDNSGGGRGDDNRKSVLSGGPAMRETGGPEAHVNHRRGRFKRKSWGGLVSEGRGAARWAGGQQFWWSPPGRADNFQGLTVGFGKGSIPERDALRTAPEGIDSVFHLADRGRVPEKSLVWLSEKRS